MGENKKMILGKQDGDVDWIYRVGSEVLTAANMKMAVFWFVAPCSLVEVYRLHGATNQNTAIFLDLSGSG
jgi:hypothetical protein